MPAKKIKIGGDWEVQFNQRARGQETPYWEGTIYLDGEAIGNFSNGGTGGPTRVFPQRICDELKQMVDNHCQTLGITDFNHLERESYILEAAEMLGYDRYGKQYAAQPETFIREYIRQSHEQMQQIKGGR